ncbi:DUF1080 domain-containing protein [Dyadobacter sp. LJ53]|uniref:DUF1080 domain-containing protein n=1 Tax=Dyadobacter chenwenxiniae TaxID=2906456 RepID=UPI001F1602B1|nr:DUF1080 domain-containing protein [Dyadobacter chenwenxiniae]MCF0050531.1 DUF1080 domain-containing protein [Dyadobacter chenwenxiniae]
MKKIVRLLLILLAFQSYAQKKKEIPVTRKADYQVVMEPDKWEFKEGKVKFEDYKGHKAMKISQGSGQVVLKNVVFQNGTIEYDIEPVLPEFALSIYFHRKDEKEQEIVYLRAGKMGNKLANEGIQYTPYFDGVNMWDMYPEYQTPAMTKAGEWNHVKLVMNGARMQVFLNNAPRPVLDIPKLEGNETQGSIAFEGSSYIANVQVKPNETDGLSPLALPDLTDNDATYLRNWAVTTPQNLPDGNELSFRNLPQPSAFTDTISAERRGLVSLTRKYGASKSRRVVWLKTKITAKEAVKTNLHLGISDEIWVFLNNQMIFVDKNLFAQGMRKYPEGRISINNSATLLSLRPGENELLIGVANDFYGWGIMARLESVEGITQTDQVADIIATAKEIEKLDLNQYEGTYGNADVNYKLRFIRKEKQLFVQVSDQEPAQLQTVGKDKFAFTTASATFDFLPEGKKLILRQGNESKEFRKE